MKNIRLVIPAILATIIPSICLGQAAQTITFSKLPDVTISADTITITATADSTLPVTLTSSTTGVCTVAGTTITVVTTGTCTVVASQGGGTAAGKTYSAATDVTQSFKVTIGKPNSATEVDAVFGLGSLITGDHTDYKVNSSANVLEGNLIGRASPQLLAGGSFQLPIPAFPKVGKIPQGSPFPWHAFVSLKFATGSQNITGYTFGITYRVHTHLDLLAGYALTPFSEPSLGFRKAAINAVQTNASAYQGKYNVGALNNNVADAFDGFPIQSLDATGKQTGVNLYAGDPLETHYRGGFMVGVSIPISLKGIISGSSNP